MRARRKRSRCTCATRATRWISPRTGPDALASAAERQPDLIVLDLMLPGLSGLDVCRALRERTDVPIIMVTARTTEEDKLAGLRAGADDYVTKPFSPRELVARIATVLRRARPGPRVITAGDVAIDLTSREVRRGGVAVPMTPAEFRLLEVLASSPGRAWTRADLGERAFGLEHDALDRTIDAHVMNLRRKLERDRDETRSDPDRLRHRLSLPIDRGSA